MKQRRTVVKRNDVGGRVVLEVRASKDDVFFNRGDLEGVWERARKLGGNLLNVSFADRNMERIELLIRDAKKHAEDLTKLKSELEEAPLLL